MYIYIYISRIYICIHTSMPPHPAVQTKNALRPIRKDSDKTWGSTRTCSYFQGTCSPRKRQVQKNHDPGFLLVKILTTVHGLGAHPKFPPQESTNSDADPGLST